MGNTFDLCFSRGQRENEVNDVEGRALKRQSNKGNLQILNNYDEEKFSVEGQVPTINAAVLTTKGKEEEQKPLSAAEEAKKQKIRSRIEEFEKRLPMRKLTIQEWVKVVTGGDEEGETISAQQLIQFLKILKDDGFWKSEGILDERNVFAKILNECGLLKDDDDSEKLNKNHLIVWGILYCKSTPAEKVKVLYDVLQSEGHERIAASDKDLPKTFLRLLGLATKVVNQYEPMVSGKDREFDDEFFQSFDKYQDTLQNEHFCDAVFGAKSALTRQEFEVSATKNTSWIFSAVELRKHLYPIIRSTITI